MEEVKKVDYVTFGLFYGITSVITAAIFLAIELALGATFLPIPILAALSVIAIPITLIVIFAIGFIGGLIVALLYNFVINRFLKFKVETA
jgi:membrane protein implicated in regulation of membrane protease activity